MNYVSNARGVTNPLGVCHPTPGATSTTAGRGHEPLGVGGHEPHYKRVRYPAPTDPRGVTNPLLVGFVTPRCGAIQ